MNQQMQWHRIEHFVGGSHRNSTAGQSPLEFHVGTYCKSLHREQFGAASRIRPAHLITPEIQVDMYSGQIIATSHDLTPNGGLVREIPLFQGNPGW